MRDSFSGRTVRVTGASGGIGGATVRRLRKEGATVLAAGRDEEALASLAEETGARPLPFELTEEDSIRTAIEGRDLDGVVNCGGWGGAIVNVSSQASLVGLAGHIAYGSSKAAMDNITRVSALELGEHGIRVNSVNPTVVMTPMSAWYWGRPEIEGPFLEQMPLGRWATEDEIAGPIVFLLSSDAALISGVCLPIDGGYTSR
ncbi:SDR family oxidoreductase [Kocuria palustris]|uniref:SDR family oxidoreductase n=1 Tax=Kocuria palustris TaxID=71999 RepID=UPI0023011538|nr:SDR family oxidoreductase [Kocuria palustris]